MFVVRATKTTIVASATHIVLALEAHRPKNNYGLASRYYLRELVLVNTAQMVLQRQNNNYGLVITRGRSSQPSHHTVAGVSSSGSLSTSQRQFFVFKSLGGCICPTIRAPVRPWPTQSHDRHLLWVHALFPQRGCGTVTTRESGIVVQRLDEYK